MTKPVHHHTRLTMITLLVPRTITIAIRGTFAAEAFRIPNARMSGSGMRSEAPPILKFCKERWVCAPQYLHNVTKPSCYQQLLAPLSVAQSTTSMWTFLPFVRSTHVERAKHAYFLHRWSRDKLLTCQRELQLVQMYPFQSLIQPLFAAHAAG